MLSYVTQTLSFWFTIFFKLPKNRIKVVEKNYFISCWTVLRRSLRWPKALIQPLSKSVFFSTYNSNCISSNIQAPMKAETLIVGTLDFYSIDILPLKKITKTLRKCLSSTLTNLQLEWEYVAVIYIFIDLWVSSVARVTLLTERMWTFLVKTDWHRKFYRTSKY